MPLPAIGALIGGLLRGGATMLRAAGPTLGRMVGRKATAEVAEVGASRAAQALGKKTTDRVVRQAIEKSAKRASVFRRAGDAAKQLIKGQPTARPDRQPLGSQRASSVGRQVVNQMFSRAVNREGKQPSFSQRAQQFVVKFVNPQQQSGGNGPEGERPSLADSLRNPKSFGDVMGGKISPQEAVQHQDAANQQQAQQDEDEAARAKVKSSLTSLAKATLGGVSALILVPAAGKKLGDAMVAAQAGLMKYNAQIANAYVKLQREDMLRKRASGAATADTTAALTEATSQLADEWRPIGDTITNVLNEIATGFTIIVKNSIAVAKGIAEWLHLGDIIIDKMPEKKKQRTEWEGLIKDLAKQGQNNRKNGPLSQ